MELSLNFSALLRKRIVSIIQLLRTLCMDQRLYVYKRFTNGVGFYISSLVTSMKVKSTASSF